MEPLFSQRANFRDKSGQVEWPDPCCLSRMYDAIVIGAGAAGLEASVRLRKTRLRFLLLEAQNRVGGRAWSVGVNHIVALGAEFMYGESLETKRRLIEYRQSYYTYEPEYHLFRDGKLQQVNVKPLEDRTIGRPLGGFSSLFRAMAVEVGNSLRLNTLVTSIEWRRGKVTVRAEENGRKKIFRARTALVTLPVGVLKADADAPGAIRFSPKIGELTPFLNSVEMEQAIRITLEFDEYTFRILNRRFGKGFPFISSPDLDFVAWWSDFPSPRPIITAWTTGPHANRIAKLPRSERTALALANLAQVLGVQSATLTHALRQTHLHNWEEDPFARGAYCESSIAPVGTTLPLTRGVKKTIYFAGEAFESEHQGTVEGAIRSGARQARKIIAHLNQETLPPTPKARAGQDRIHV